MDYVPVAVPFFLLAIVIELVYGLSRGRNTYRSNDAVNSLSMGTLSTLAPLATLDVAAMIFASVDANYGLWNWDLTSPWVWVAGWLAYDFCYYWFHRISHERQFFWASHVAHHQSEEFNLSTALRQTGTGFLTNWVFYLPLFLLGMPLQMFITIYSLHLIYQFWIHTRHIGKLGILEWFMVTPSNHRGHHAQNPRYVDKNYGGLLIIWDRLFGTYAEEVDDEEIVYGITTPLHSWNPIWANVHVFTGMAQDMWRTNSWGDRLRVPFARTGWQPADVAATYPREKVQLQEFKKYDPPVPRRWQLVAVLQLLVGTAAYGWVLANAAILTLPIGLVALYTITFHLCTVGMSLESRDSLLRWDTTRLISSLLLVSGLIIFGQIDINLYMAACGYLLVSFVINRIPKP